MLRAATSTQLDAAWQAWSAVPAHLVDTYAETLARNLGWSWGDPQLEPSNIGTDYRLRDRSVTASARGIDITELSFTVAETDDPTDRESLARWFEAEVARLEALHGPADREDAGEPAPDHGGEADAPAGAASTPRRAKRGGSGDRRAARWTLGVGLGSVQLSRSGKRATMGFRTGLAVAAPDSPSELYRARAVRRSWRERLARRRASRFA